MATVYTHPTLGDDSRTFAQAQSTATPWKTPMKAYNDPSVLAGDNISIGTPGAGALTWSDVDAVCDSKGAAGTATNVAKAVVWRTAVGVQAHFVTATGAAYLPGKYGNSIDTEGADNHPVRGHCWRFINPAAMTFYLNVDAGATTTWSQTGTVPTEVDGGYSSCLYFVDKGSGTNHKVSIVGPTISRYDGMGVMFNNVGGSDVYDYDISHCVTGIRWEGARADGRRASTTLNGAVVAGAQVITVTSAAGMATGDCVAIGAGTDNDIEVRQISGIVGNVLSLAPGPADRPGGIRRPGLHYGHLSGTLVETQFGARMGRSHNNDCYGQNDVGGGNDFGAEGYTLNKGANHVLIWRPDCFDNYGALASFDYGIDGGAVTPYGMGPGSKNILTEGNWHGSHSLLESGTDATQLAAGNDDGGLIFTFNDCWGINDRQSNFGGSPSAPIALLRAAPGWLIRRNSFWIFNGPTANGGFRWSSGGGFSGALDGLRILENIIGIKYNSALYDFAGLSAYPASTVIDYNLVYRTTGANPAARGINGTATYAYPSGLAAWRTATGFSAHDVWGSDPLFRDPDNGDLSLLPGSPAIGMAANGDPVGAHDFGPSSLPHMTLRF